MPPPTTDLFLWTVALVGIVIVISALLTGFIEKSGLPHISVFLGQGALIGPAGLNLMNADIHSPILRVVGTLCLVLVLFTDALTINLKEVRQHGRLAILVLGPGTLVSAALIALISWRVLGLHPAAASILGAALASTDPVLLRGLVRRPGLDGKVKQALRLEGGMNDAVLLPIVLVAMTIWAQGRPLTPLEWAHLALTTFVLSPAAGVVIGLAAIGMLQLVRKQVGVRRDYESIYSLGVAFAAFAAAESVHGSGFLAAFAAGLTISELEVELCDCFLEYGETTAEMALMFAFVLFGTSLVWTGLSIIRPETLLFTIAVFCARPAAFIPALLPTDLRWKDRLLIAWFGPRALSSLLLVLLPVIAGVPGSESLVPVCCLVVLFSVLLHGLSPNLLFRNGRGREIPARPTPAPNLPVPEEGTTSDALVRVNEHVPDGQPQKDSEYISITEVTDLQSRSQPLLIIDARSERTYDDRTEDIPGAIRLHPDSAVQMARDRGIPKTAVLAVLCA
ncbi:MAG: hypothetical protein JWO48_1282 [Bryobacterales bacterium]|nr:hypothetical protein [Bryobacterales bacterium]